MLSAAHRLSSKALVLDQIIKREGSGYVNLPNDKGGPTRYGVTLAAYRSYMDKPDAGSSKIRDLSEQTARKILQEDYLEGYNFEAVIDDASYSLVLDCSVLHGPRGAALILQRAVEAKEDGIIGPVTAGKANSLRRKDLVSALLRERSRWFINICERDPSQIVFLEGWMVHRVFSFLPY